MLTEQPASASSVPESESTAGTDKGKSSWFKSAIPFGKRKEGDGEGEEDKQAAAGAEKKAETETKQEDENLPPNYLGFNVPEGASSDIAGPGESAPGQNPLEAAPTKNSQPSNEGGEDEDTNEPVGTTDSADAGPSSSGKPQVQQSQRKGSMVPGSRAYIATPEKQRVHNPHSSNPNAIPIAGGQQVGGAGRSKSISSESTGASGSGASPARLLGSRSSVAAQGGTRPHNPYSANPGRIPTAGGVSVGSKQFEQRRASRVDPSDLGGLASSSGPAARLDKEGSPDAVTERNTLSNVSPQKSAPAETEQGNDAVANGGGSTFTNPFSKSGGDPVKEDENVTPATGVDDQPVKDEPKEKKGGLFSKIKEKVKQ